MTLLEKAKKVADDRRKCAGTLEQVERCELALALLNGEITNKQAAKAMGHECRIVPSIVSNSVAQGIRHGWIKAEFIGLAKSKARVA